MGDLAAHHHADDFITLHVFRHFGGDIFAITKHRNFIGNLKQLTHLMGDVNNTLALGLQRADDLEEVGHFLFGEG